jgi:hypothetical protein
MNEHEFRQALHDTMTVAAPPPPMNEAPVLDRAKRAHRRRQATWASAGSAAAVMAVVAGAMVLAPSGDDRGAAVGAPPTEANGAGPANASTKADVPAVSGTETSPESKGTEPQWPNGQTDATARSGAEYDKGVRLLDELAGAVPDGYETPEDLVYADPAYQGAKLRDHQAAAHDAVNWEYYAILPVSANGGLGKLFAQVNDAATGIAGEGCELSRTLWNLGGGACEEVTVAGTTLGVVTDTGPESKFDQWVGFRHPDGTVVYVAQDNEFKDSGQPALSTVPFTAQQLAELATDARFLLN